MQIKEGKSVTTKKDGANSIKTGSFNTSQSNYFEKTNSTTFKPMYYMQKDS